MSLFINLLFLYQGVQAQEKYWVYFNDKGNYDRSARWVSATTLANRALTKLSQEQYSDVPVQEAYVRAVQARSAAVVNRSKWLNAITAYLTQQELEAVMELPFVKEVKPVMAHLRAASGSAINEVAAFTALEQVNGEALRKVNLDGRGVVIGVIDGGFYRANEMSSLHHIWDDGRLLSVRNFTVATPDFYLADSTDGHGVSVLHMIAGRDMQAQYGMAPGATFCLATTEVKRKEYRGEEDYWIAAVEWMDSLGIRLVNTSLGYSTDFDNPEENHTASEMNGATTAITKAARIAATEKGMLIVVAAGNEGADKDWQVVAAPADAEGVVSVGATDELQLKRDYSAIGPHFLDYLKPDIACFSAGGTSLAAPVITALAACIIQKTPTLTNTQVIEILKKASHLYPYGNNYLGYGIPDTRKILKLLQPPGTKPVDAGKQVMGEGNEVALKLRNNAAGFATVFHKKDGWIVIKQETVATRNNKVVIQRALGAQRTTVSSGDRIIEVIWQ